MGETAVYCYAILRGATDDDLAGQPGHGGRALRRVTHGELSAVVSDVDLDEFGEEALRRNLEDLAWLEGVARTHDAVARHLAQRAATAPLRLATIFLGDDALRARLVTWSDAAGRALDRIQGRKEWSVKAFQDPEPTPPPASSGSETEEAGQGVGAAYLARRRAALADRARTSQASAELGEELHTQLHRRAAAARRLPAQDRSLADYTGEMILNGSYLVDDTTAGDFAAAARALAEGRPGLRIEVAGPWPPYSFATLEDV